MVLEFDQTGSGDLATADLAHRYLWGPAVDQLFADEQVGSLANENLNDTIWALTDHLGTPRDWIDDSANVLDQARPADALLLCTEAMSRSIASFV